MPRRIVGDLLEAVFDPAQFPANWEGLLRHLACAGGWREATLCLPESAVLPGPHQLRVTRKGVALLGACTNCSFPNAAVPLPARKGRPHRGRTLDQSVTQPAPPNDRCHFTLSFDQHGCPSLVLSGITKEHRDEHRREVAELADALRRAYHFTMQAMEARAWEARFQALTELTPKPTFLVDGTCTVVFMNARAAETVREKKGLLVGSDRKLRLSTPGDTEALQQKVARLLRASPAHTSVRDFMPFSAHEIRHAHCLRLTRLESNAQHAPGRSAGPGAPKPLALVTAHYRGDRTPVAPAMLQELFGLTRAEATLAAALAEGMTLKEYAESRNVRITTVRWHLNNVMRTLDCNTQAELVSLILPLSV